MFFELSEGGKIMICADAKIKPCMVELSPPDDFEPDEMGDWKITAGEFVHDPKPKPIPEPTTEERIQQLEAQNETLLECLLEMSEIVYA